MEFSNVIDISTLLSDKDKKLILDSIKLFEKSGLFAKNELNGFIKSGKIPVKVLDALKVALGITMEPGRVVSPKTTFTDTDVMYLSAAIYASKVSQLQIDSPETVRPVNPDERKIIDSAVTKLNNYMIALQTRKAALQGDLSKAEKAKDADKVEKVNKYISDTVDAMKVAQQVMARLATMSSKKAFKNSENIAMGIALGKTLDFVTSPEMRQLISFLDDIKVTPKKDKTGKIIGRTADVPKKPEVHPAYSNIEELLEEFLKASKIPTTKKKEKEPIVIEELPGGPKRRDIDGGGDPGIVAKKPKVGEEEAGKPKVGEEEAGKPKVGEEEAGKPKVGEEEAGKPKVGEEEAGKPKVGEEEAGKPKVGEEGETPVPGAVNQAKTKKLSVGRRIINWIGRHWFGLSAIALAVTLAVGAIFPAAAVAGTAFAAFNLNAPNFLFAVLGVGVVNHFAFGGLRHRNSAQEHLMRRERKVQRRIRKSEKLLEQVKKNQVKIAEIMDLREKATNPSKIQGYTNDILALHKKNSSLDSENMIIMQELQEEFMPVKMPPKWRIFSRMKHRFLTVTGNATLARNEAELEYAHRKKIEKLPETPEKAEKVEAMTMNGNLVDEFANFQFAKRKLQYSIEQRQQAVEELVPDEKTRTHTAKSIISGLKKRHQKLHDMGKATQIVKGPVGAAAKPVGLAAKQIVESHKGEVPVTMDRVDGKLITTYDDGSITVETKNKQTRTYEPKK